MKQNLCYQKVSDNYAKSSYFRHSKVHSECQVITLPMPSAVCNARISLRTFTASLRVAGRQLQRTTKANPSTTCSTLDKGLRSRERERLLLELCIKRGKKTFNNKKKTKPNFLFFDDGGKSSPALHGSCCCNALPDATDWWAAAASLLHCPKALGERQSPLGQWSTQSLREHPPATLGNPPSGPAVWWRQGLAAPHPCGLLVWK